MWLRKTNHGRIVYDRAPHGFTINDIKRISKKSDNTYFEVPEDSWDNFLKQFGRLIVNETINIVEKLQSSSIIDSILGTQAFTIKTGEAPPTIEETGVIIIIRGDERS